MSAPLDASLAVVVTTVGAMDEARQIAQALVERRLAGCVQLSPIESVYRWEGAMHRDPEVRIVCKTAAERAPALEQALRELHPYALPQILRLGVEHADAAYAAWVLQETLPG